jgi:hypothetical protein
VLMGQWLSWHPKGNVLAAGCEDATVWMWQREWLPLPMTRC